MEIINKFTGRIVKAVDDVLVKSFKLVAKTLFDKFCFDFDNCKKCHE